MPETELGEVESANEALDRADWIVRPDIVLNPRRKETGLIPAIADLECAIRHKPNRTCCSRKCPPFLPSLVGQIISTNSRHPVPRRGAYHDRHERWDGMRWTRQRFARDGIAGRVGERPVSDQQRADERCCSV